MYTIVQYSNIRYNPCMCTIDRSLYSSVQSLYIQYVISENVFQKIFYDNFKIFFQNVIGRLFLKPKLITVSNQMKCLFCLGKQKQEIFINFRLKSNFGHFFFRFFFGTFCIQQLQKNSKIKVYWKFLSFFLVGGKFRQKKKCPHFYYNQQQKRNQTLEIILLCLFFINVYILNQALGIVEGLKIWVGQLPRSFYSVFLWFFFIQKLLIIY
eukprot:TRINITY_DN1565_c1_g1_i1.p6 TRINITY_DN1565_c1_g1~~TRINITY_DN1565_c1_g1_i1.p6  ORF type:complete len:210 (-),score=-1.90 TRINITY_DN1565_c1_g1_i1:1554-2183(-)